MKIIIPILYLLLFTLICFGALIFRVKSPIISTEDKWFATILLLLCGLVIYSICQLTTISGNLGKLFYRFTIVVSVFCFFLAVYGILQKINIFPSSSYLRITGGFDNPAGYAASLCAGFPMILYLLNSYRSKWVIGVTILTGSLVIIAVILSGSRAGIMSIAIMLVIWFLSKVKVTKRLVLMFTVGIALFISILYFYKKDSADGRILIWQCSWAMIIDKPLLGHGMEGFRANYMNYQASYFKQNPDSYYVMLADNTNRPFNEYILLLVNYGIVGFILFTAFVCFLWKSYRRNPCYESKAALLCLTGIAVFSCFSYPLSYPFVCVMMLFSVYTIILLANYPIRISFKEKKMICFVTICLSLAGIVIVSKGMLNHISWGKTAEVSLIKQTDHTFARYEKLLSKLGNNHLFLYNYAAELNYGGYYSQSQEIAQLCSKLWADYDLQLLMGDNCVKMELYEKAERHFEHAMYMCPVRFIPLHKLMKIYQLKEEHEKAVDIAKRIVSKPVKIQSGRIKRIKEEAKEFLKINSR